MGSEKGNEVDSKDLQAGKEFGIGKTNYGSPTAKATVLHSPYVDGNGEKVIDVHINGLGDKTVKLSDVGLDSNKGLGSDKKPAKHFLTKL